MRSRLLAGLAVLVLALTACGGGDSTTTANSSGRDGASAPAATGNLLDFEAETVTGDVVDANQYAGKDLVVWFWAPW